MIFPLEEGEMFSQGMQIQRLKRQKFEEGKRLFLKKKKVVISWNPTDRTDLKQFKEPVVAYEVHSPCVRQILNNWA